jgi:dTDP-4-dehydrorhamnose reductase
LRRAAPPCDDGGDMRALITGANGTVGRALRAHLSSLDAEVVAWDRHAVPIDDYAAMESFVRGSGASVVFHLAIASQPSGRHDESWLVNYHWTSELAWLCRTLGLRFIFASTAMVFSNDAKGPFTTASVADAADGYGYEKRVAEARVAHQCPEAIVARLGWQIGELGANTMQRYLERHMAQSAEIRASTRWLPACSFLEDTVQALAALVWASPGTYMIDGNQHWTFFEIATALAHARAPTWNVVACEDFVFDQRMLDERVPLPSLRSRLPRLPPRMA